METMFGYSTITTFWQDFSIADQFGIPAIEDTYKRSFDEWKDDYRYLTELVLVLNWKIWEHWEKEHLATARVYDALWREASKYAETHLKGEELAYYLRITD